MKINRAMGVHHKHLARGRSRKMMGDIDARDLHIDSASCAKSGVEEFASS
jgi:hypothetical protein